ncbi:S8 family peptidase [Exiguobacterium oxidotolerans]|uniref:S8 family peptidase n=1 Tax=Exiguobacterium oxidotolerans TaxID=223958 RepID=UPI000493E0BB|nr:S8 family serine peptidase [Exiguobacterium oxidotolerans]
MKKQLVSLTVALAVGLPTTAFASSQYVQYDPTFTDQQKQTWLKDQGLKEVRPLKQDGFSLVEPLAHLDEDEIETDLIPVTEVEKAVDSAQLQQTYLDQSRVPTYWKYSHGKSDIRVAIIDDAIDTKHSEFKNVIYKTTTISGIRKPDDHGTHVAGIVAAAEDGKGIVGVASGVKLIGADVFDGDFASSIDIGDGILYAIAQGADVINLSLGQYEFDPYMEAALKKAEAKNIIVVGAAGNDGRNKLLFPASMTSVISVGSVGALGRASSFSNYGRGLNIMAPGEGVYSTIVGNKYGYLDGTSMATPIVSGVIALAKSKNPFVSNNALRNKLYAAATKKSGDTSLHYGNGRLNAGVLAKIPAPISKISIPSVVKPNQTFSFYFNEYSNAKTRTRLYKNGTVVKTFTDKKLLNGLYKFSYKLKDKGTYKLVFTTSAGRHTRTVERVLTVK